jgi:hypothetical protein
MHCINSSNCWEIVSQLQFWQLSLTEKVIVSLWQNREWESFLVLLQGCPLES